MANILIAWELGAGLGHLSYLSVIASELNAKGHSVTLALNDPTNVENFNWPSGVNIVPSPAFRSMQSNQPKTASLPCIMLTRGFQSPKLLKGMVRSWHGLFKLTQPDLMLFDYAPTAMLAARGMSFKKVVIGSGFSEPEPGTAALNMLPGVNGACRAAQLSEEKVVKHINEVCRSLNYPPVNYLSDLYQHDLALISSLPDLDIHPRSQKTSHYFQFDNTEQNQEILTWPDNHQKNILAYLRAHSPNCPVALDALVETDANIICYCANLKPEIMQRYSKKGITFSLRPFDMAHMLKAADVMICHAGKGTISESLQQGTPLILLPTHMEQNMNTVIVEKLGVGLRGRSDKGPKAVCYDINRLLNNNNFTDKATGFSKQLKDQPIIKTEQQLIEKICNLL